MIYECAYCHKFYDEDEGMMVLTKTLTIVGNNEMYVFKCKNCMAEKDRKAFEKIKGKNI